jgi:hypothetical protein
MSGDLEDRLRAALRTRAEDFTTSPDAWEQTAARASRRSGRPGLRMEAGRGARRGLTRFTPLAAAAAVLAVILAAAGLAATGDLRAVLPGSARASLPQEPPTPFSRQAPRRGRFLMEQRCDAKARVSAVVSFGETTAWFGRIKGSTAWYLCDRTRNGGGAALATLSRGVLASYFGGPWPPFTGIAVTSVTSVTAVLPDGRRIPGAVRFGHGFPFAVWWANYPPGESATLVFRDAAGHVATRISVPAPKPVNPLAHPVLLTPADAGYCGNPPQNTSFVRVRQTMQHIAVWTYIQFGRQQGSNTLVLCENTGVNGDSVGFSLGAGLAAGQLAEFVGNLSLTSTLSGIIAPSVTSVTAVLPNGRQYRGMIVTGRGFPYRVWLVSYPNQYAATLVFGNASGQQVASLHAHSGVYPVQ